MLGWGDRKATVEDLDVGADDEAVRAARETADKAGIDASFGWPGAFAAFLAAHQVGDVPVPDGLTGQQWRSHARYLIRTRATAASASDRDPPYCTLPAGCDSVATALRNRMFCV